MKFNEPVPITYVVNKMKKEKEIILFCVNWFKFKPFKYQKDFLNECIINKRVAGLWPRQSGKSTSVAAFCLYVAITKPNQTILLVAPTQRQSGELYKRIREFINVDPRIFNYVTKYTATEVRFKNGSRIISLPAGPEGNTIRGITADGIVEEEAGYLKGNIHTKVLTPMIAATNGWIIKIGTPFSKGHFHESCYGEGSKYKLFYINYEDVIREGLYDKEFIDQQKRELTDIEFQTEYEAKFIDILDSYFSADLIDSCIDDYPMVDERRLYGGM